VDAPRAAPPAAAPGQAEPPGAAFAHLDELPPDQPDGRALGEAAARSYGQGGTSSFGTSRRFPARQRIPRGVTLAERPAVGTLLHLHSVEEAHHRRTGRYGTLSELQAAGLLVLDVSLDGAGFKRKGYTFSVMVDGDGYRAEAVPQAPIGRSFLVDDTGKVRDAGE
jgi:hypothetical protein